MGKDLEHLASLDSSFQKKRCLVIGLGKFKMEIDIAAETKKMKQEMRKVGDKSGVGCGPETQEGGKLGRASAFDSRQ